MTAVIRLENGRVRVVCIAGRDKGKAEEAYSRVHNTWTSAANYCKVKGIRVCNADEVMMSIIDESKQLSMF